MKLFSPLTNILKKISKIPMIVFIRDPRWFTTIGIKHADANQEAIIKNGREQFRTLVKKGLNIPVVFL